jgi:hypothetical protein
MNSDKEYVIQRQARYFALTHAHTHGLLDLQGEEEEM